MLHLGFAALRLFVSQVTGIVVYCAACGFCVTRFVLYYVRWKVGGFLWEMQEGLKRCSRFYFSHCSWSVNGVSGDVELDVLCSCYFVP